MNGLDWLSVEDACDFLRVSEDNATVIQSLAGSIPAYIEQTTGLPISLICDDDCDETTRLLCLFLLQLLFNPDGTDSERLWRVVASLTKTVKANAIAMGADGSKEWLPDWKAQWNAIHGK